MLVRITNICRMGCSHCMVNAGPAGDSMSMETFRQTAEFIDRNGFAVALLSGGEPTEHSQLLEFIDHLKSLDIQVVLLSNGMFLDDKKLTDEILARKIMVQITNDGRFYPNKIKHIDSPLLMYEDTIRLVSPFGRAVENKLTCTRQSPLCFNLRSITRKLRDFKEAVYRLRNMGKMCIPSVNTDGSLVAGEAPSCSPFGHVTDSNLVLTNRLCDLRCNKCGLADGLPDAYKEAIGEKTSRPS